MVGDRKDSALYVRHKQTACRRAGIRSENFLFDECVAQVQVDGASERERWGDRVRIDRLLVHTGHCCAKGGGAESRPDN